MFRSNWFMIALALLLSAGMAQADIVVTEIMQNPSAVSDSDGEWFEVYNNSDAEVDMVMFVISDNDGESFSVNSSVLIAAHGYAVFGVNGDFATNGGVNVDYVYSGLNLSNSADEIVITDGGGFEHDRVEYDGGPNFPDPNGASMQLLDPVLDNNVGSNWAAADLPFGDGDFGTPGAMNEWDQGGGEDTTAVTIMELQTNTEAWLDMWVEVTGIVTQGNGTIHTGYVDVFVQDETGYGIMLYSGNIADGEGLDRGDEVTIVGQVDQYFDTTELVNFYFTELSIDNPLPEPMMFDTGDFDAGAVPYEGVWAELTGEITSAPGLPEETYNFTISDGTGDATIRMYSDLGLDLTMYAVGDVITVRGTVDTYQGLAQLQPSDAADVEAATQDPVVFDLSPTQTVVPAGGGNIYYDVQLTSNIGGQYNGVQFWTMVESPAGNMYGPLTTINFNLMPFMDVMQSGLSQYVPANAPAGEYMFYAFVGYPTLNVSDSFTFVKQGEGAGVMEMDEWHGTAPNFAGEEDATVAVPAEFALSAAYPNPFNPTTSVAVSLPASSELTVSVFNVMGRQVAELASGQFQAGQHNFTFDASSLSSGLYFIQAQVPGELNAIQKVTLMK